MDKMDNTFHCVRRNLYKCILLGFSLILLNMQFAQAAQDKLRLSGFLTLAGYHGSSNQLGFRSSTAITNGATRDEWVFDDLSLIGAQANYNFNANWQLVTQVVLRDEPVNTDLDRIKIATLNYRPNSSLLFRVGRFYPRAYLLTESKLIGYANNTILPAVDFYGQLPLPFVNGIDITYTKRINSGVFSSSLFYGDSTVTTESNDEKDGKLTTDLKNFVGLNFEYQWGDWVVTAGYAQIEQTKDWTSVADVRSFLNGLANPPPLPQPYTLEPWPEALTISDGLNFEGSVYRYSGLGLEYNHNQWKIRSELGRLRVENLLIPSTRSAYISIYYQVDRITPFFTLSMIDSDKRYTISTQPDQNLVNFFDANLNINTKQVIDIIGHSLKTKYEQSSISLGMRWDFAAKQAVKFQYERKWVKENSAGLWQTNGAFQVDAEAVDVFMLSYDRMF